MEEIKSDPALTTIPVVVLTTSADGKESNNAYVSHSKCCIAKPVDFGQYMNVVRIIDNYCLSAAKLPKYV